MSKILNQIKTDNLSARKNRETDKVSSLTTLISEIEMIAKNANREVVDLDVIESIKKTVKNLDVMIQSVKEDVKDRYIVEKEILLSYLPNQMTFDEIKNEMSSMISDLKLEGSKSIGILMKTFKEKFNGLYEGQTAAKISKDLLK